MKTLMVRVVLPGMLALALWAVAHRIIAVEFVQRLPIGEGLERAIEWDPTNAHYRSGVGQLLRDSLDGQDVELAVEHLELAVELNRHNWRYQLELARALEVAGEKERARETYYRALELNPASGNYQWRIANYFLRIGETDQAIELMGVATAREPDLLEPAFVLWSKLDLEGEELINLWPDDPESRLLLLNLLLGPRSVPESWQTADLLDRVWRDVADSSLRSTRETNLYLRHLLGNGRADAARQVWSEVTSRSELADDAFASGSNRVWNGDFERTMQNIDLDWETTRHRDLTIRRRSREDEPDSMALRLDFRGARDQVLKGVFLRVVVEPEQDIELSIRFRAESLQVVGGLEIQVVDPNGGQILTGSGPILGDTGWKQHKSTFRVPQDTRIVDVRVKRHLADIGEVLVRGSLWLDDLWLRPIDPGGVEP